MYIVPLTQIHLEKFIAHNHVHPVDIIKEGSSPILNFPFPLLRSPLTPLVLTSYSALATCFQRGNGGFTAYMC